MPDEPSLSLAERERLRLEGLEFVQTDTLSSTGVLLSDQIKEYATKFKLIHPFLDKNLKPASYKLTIGTEYAVGGIMHTLLDSQSDRIVIPPFEVAIIKTRETLNLPRFLIGRWNIQVSRAYEGLVWVGGPQVDPGYVGHLFCPIYNLSSSEVSLGFGDSIAVIDFVKTTPVGPTSKPYPRPPDRLVLQDYPLFKSGLAAQVKGIARLEREFKALEQRVNNAVGVAIALVGVLVAALAVLVTSFAEKNVSVNAWSVISIALSCLALFFSTGAAISSLRLRRENERR